MRFAAIAILSICVVPAWSAPGDSYAGQEQRPIKALSDAEQADLLAGKGMGLAKAAELNGYPGPRHVLDLATQLALTSEQRQASEALFAMMQTRAKALGIEIIEAERLLDRAFASGELNERQLGERLERIGALNAQLRGTHLAAHLEQARLLSSEQVATYNKLRGYASSAGAQHSEHVHHGH